MEFTTQIIMELHGLNLIYPQAALGGKIAISWQTGQYQLTGGSSGFGQSSNYGQLQLVATLVGPFLIPRLVIMDNIVLLLYLILVRSVYPPIMVQLGLELPFLVLLTLMG